MPYSGAEVVRALQKAGFGEVGQKGSHMKLRRERDGRTQTVIVPLHTELAPGTLASIGRQAGLTKEEIGKLL